MRQIQSFVKRSGRLTTSQQNALNNLKDQYIIKNIDFGIFDNDNPIILEIGFGNGDSLFEMAQNEPEYNFIGIEVYEAGVGRLINNAHNTHLDNLKVINTDAVEVLKHTPDDIFNGFQLYFPDPWHKKRHNKRRIVNQEFLGLIAQKIKSSGFVHMATDWEEYAQQMLEELTISNSFVNTCDGFAEKPARRPTTKFEKRGLKLGHGVWDLIFKKL